MPQNASNCARVSAAASVSNAEIRLWLMPMPGGGLGLGEAGLPPAGGKQLGYLVRRGDEVEHGRLSVGRINAFYASHEYLSNIRVDAIFCKYLFDE